MRSEKEIREEKKRLLGLPIEESAECDGARCEILAWVLEGPPRYSVEELKKLYGEWRPSLDIDSEKRPIEQFYEWVDANPDKVREILAEAKK